MSRTGSRRPIRQQGPAEFVALVALMIGLTALSIDVTLVALPDIALTFAIADPNDRQFIVTAYMLGFAGGQPFYGPLSDRFGRKPVLFAGLALFAASSLAAIAAPSLALILAARAAQGFGAAAPRIIAIAIVRDRYAGRGMSRVMSFVMMVFIVVPILAPSAGAGILYLGGWRWIFVLLFVVALLIVAWSGLRLPETRAAQDRMPLSASAIMHALRLIATNRQTLWYTLATGFLFATLFGYIASAEQIFVDAYALGADFPLVFGAVAFVMVPASITNSRLVERLGMRRLSHLALVGLVATCAVAALFGYPRDPPLILFVGFLALLFFCFGVIMPNFNALAMQPLGHVAGTGSSVVGSYTTAAGAVFGGLVGLAFDGSVRPLLIGITGLGVLALAMVLVAERGRLFQVKTASG